jgi:5-methylcytosine-specific restriction endonuclease McrA
MTQVHKFLCYREIGDKVNVPSIQRDLIPKQVEAMRIHINERRLRSKEPIFGAIDLVKLNETLFVIDGQHRLEALRQEYQSCNEDVPFCCVIHNAESKEEMREIFITLNKGIPLPGFLLEADLEESKKSLLKEILAVISAKQGFDVKRLTRPYLHINNFMHALTDSKLFNRISTLDEFLQIFARINSTNKLLSEEAQYRKQNLITAPMLKKCKEWDNFVGLDKNMPYFEDEYDLKIFDNLDAPLFHVEQNIHLEEESDEGKRTLRKQFSQNQRVQIWTATFGEESRNEKCPYCKIEVISISNFHIGHVISLKNNGSNEFSNLRPICQSCNSEMGKSNMNLSRYKPLKENQKQTSENLVGM